MSLDVIVYVSDWRNSRIQKLTLEGVFVNQWGKWLQEGAGNQSGRRLFTKIADKWLREEGTDYGGCPASGHIQLVLNRI